MQSERDEGERRKGEPHPMKLLQSVAHRALALEEAFAGILRPRGRAEKQKQCDCPSGQHNLILQIPLAHRALQHDC